MFITKLPNIVYIVSEVYAKIKSNTLIEIVFIGKPYDPMQLDLISAVVVTDRVSRKHEPMQRLIKRSDNEKVEETVIGTIEQFKNGMLIIDSMVNLKEQAN